MQNFAQNNHIQKNHTNLSSARQLCKEIKFQKEVKLKKENLSKLLI